MEQVSYIKLVKINSKLCLKIKNDHYFERIIWTHLKNIKDYFF